MAHKRLPFIKEHKITGKGGATDVVEISLPGDRAKDVLTLIRAWDEDNACTSLTVKYGNITGEKEIAYAGAPQAGERLVYNEPMLHVRHGQRVIVVFTGATSGDKLNVVVMGWKESE